MGYKGMPDSDKEIYSGILDESYSFEDYDADYILRDKAEDMLWEDQLQLIYENEQYELFALP